jgi:cytochrome b561
MNTKTNIDRPTKFSKGIIVIHWLTTLLLILLFIEGIYMANITPLEKIGMIKIHVILGILVFVLTIIRVFLIFSKPQPKPLKTGSALKDKLTIWSNYAFYVFLFGISFSGIATLVLGGYLEALSNGNFENIKAASEIPPLKGHMILSILTLLLMVLHIFGTMKYIIKPKENRMKP